MFAPLGAASSRNSELLASLIELRSPTAVVTERGADLGLERQPRWRYDAEPGLDELLSPLLYALAPQLLTYELAVLVGGSFYGYGDPVLSAIGDRLIYESEQVALSEIPFALSVAGERDAGAHASETETL